MINKIKEININKTYRIVGWTGKYFIFENDIRVSGWTSTIKASKLKINTLNKILVV